jgi:hypothetical protein
MHEQIYAHRHRNTQHHVLSANQHVSVPRTVGHHATLLLPYQRTDPGRAAGHSRLELMLNASSRIGQPSTQDCMWRLQAWNKHCVMTEGCITTQKQITARKEIKVT